MADKLFIVSPGNERLYRSLCSSLANEPDVVIFYDRRSRGPAPRWRGAERRSPSDVEERIRSDGFAVVRPAPPAKRAGNIRWTA
jgi:hypothetical protein